MKLSNITLQNKTTVQDVSWEFCSPWTWHCVTGWSDF